LFDKYSREIAIVGLKIITTDFVQKLQPLCDCEENMLCTFIEH